MTIPLQYLEYKILGVGIPSRYSDYLLMVKSSSQRRVYKYGIGIDTFGIDKMELSGIRIDKMELTPSLVDTPQSYSYILRVTVVEAKS